MIKRLAPLLIKLGFIFGLALTSSFSFAAAEKVHMDRMLEGSALIIQGTVTGQRVEPGEGKHIHTILTINITDIVKGSWGQPTIDISFLGGSLNGLALRVGGQHIPALGQEGVFFIENPSRRQVNPIYGWEQGIFVVEMDSASGEKIVKTAQKQTITQIEFLPNDAPEVNGISNGIAAGIQVMRASELSAPYTLEQFKSTLRNRLAEGQ